jgi:hypothetical protein
MTWPAASTVCCGPAETHQLGPIETTFETIAKSTGAQVAARRAFGLVRLAVAAGFEPAEAFTSRAFEFGGVWSRLSRGSVADCGRPWPTANETTSETKRSRNAAPSLDGAITSCPRDV